MKMREAILMCNSVFVMLGLACGSLAAAQDDESETREAFNGQPMTAARLGQLIRNVDAEAVQDGATWFFHTAELETIVVFDIAADRMRILIPISEIDGLDQQELVRVLQANFDSALDARYAIARGMLWGVFIHPLSTLTDLEFLVGLGQTANVVSSWGSSYSSGLLIFGSGDSAEIERNRLIERLKEKTDLTTT